MLITQSAEYRFIDYYGTNVYNANDYVTPLSNLLNGIYDDNYTRPTNTVFVDVFGTENWEMAAEIYSDTNRYRNSYGSSPLNLSDSLSEAAMQRAAEIAFYYDHNHMRPNGLQSGTAVSTYIQGYGENILYATLNYDADDLMSAWMNSEGHKANILREEFNQIGVGVFVTDDMIFAVQEFGTGVSTSMYPSYQVRNTVRTVETAPYYLDFAVIGDRDITIPVGGTASLVFGNNNLTTRTFTRIVPKYSSGYSVVDIDVDDAGNTVLTGLTPGDVTLTFNAYTGQRDGITVHVTVKSRNLEGECGESATYFQDYADGSLSVTGSGPMTDFTSKKAPEWDLSAIKSVTLRSGITHVGNRAFASASNLTEISLPQTLVSIGSEAFYGASITSVTIPASVVSIGDNAFANCRRLKDVYYGGTQDMWKQIVQDSSDFSGVTVHYSKGEFPTSGSLGKSLTWSYDPASKTLVILGSGSSWSGSSPKPYDIFASDITTLILRTGVVELKSGMLDALYNLEKVTISSSTTTVSIPHVSRLKKLRVEGGTDQWKTLQKQITLPAGCNLTLVNRDGSVQTESTGERVDLVEVRDSAGNLQSMEVTIHNKLDTPAVTLPEVIPTGVSVRITNSNVQPVEVTVPVTNATPGMVLTRTDASGTKVVIRDCAVRDDGLVFTIAGGTYETISVADNTETFIDVQGVKHWSQDAVEFVVARKLFNGTGNGKFEPLTTMTRGMVVTVLYHLANDPAAGEANFTDVAPGDFWYKPVAWATANGIMSGYPDGSFGGSDGLTREQLVTVLYQYAVWMGYDVSSTTSIDSFADAKDVSGFAQKAVQWAVSLDLIHGVGNNLLAPKNEATRSEVAAIVKNYCAVVLHKDIG